MEKPPSKKDLVTHLMRMNLIFWKQTATISMFPSEVLFQINSSSSGADHLY